MYPVGSYCANISWCTVQIFIKQVHILPKHPHIHTPAHYSTRYTTNEIFTIQSSTFSIRSPWGTWYFCLQELHRGSLHFKTKSLHLNHVSSLHTETQQFTLFGLPYCQIKHGTAPKTVWPIFTKTMIMSEFYKLPNFGRQILKTFWSK